MTLYINNIRCYAYHGCLPEENIIGQWYRTDIELQLNNAASLQSDKLEDTVDYTLIHDVVRKEMKQPAKLIEHVAWRIGTALQNTLQHVSYLKVMVTKFNPPVNGMIGDVCVAVELKAN
ncbi:MAG: dihydroneopterin aldolase [Bacteroidetes bacterium]|nr:dihydroneopterin aldolase [Bacteroidota bacterium]